MYSHHFVIDKINADIVVFVRNKMKLRAQNLVCTHERKRHFIERNNSFPPFLHICQKCLSLSLMLFSCTRSKHHVGKIVISLNIINDIGTLEVNFLTMKKFFFLSSQFLYILGTAFVHYDEAHTHTLMIYMKCCQIFCLHIHAQEKGEKGNSHFR